MARLGRRLAVDGGCGAESDCYEKLSLRTGEVKKRFPQRWRGILEFIKLRFTYLQTYVFVVVGEILFAEFHPQSGRCQRKL